MRSCLLLSCVLAAAHCAPQDYSSAPAAPLTDDTYATIQEVFGGAKQTDGGYSGTAPASEKQIASSSNNNVDVLVQVIKDSQ